MCHLSASLSSECADRLSLVAGPCRAHRPRAAHACSSHGPQQVQLESPCRAHRPRAATPVHYTARNKCNSSRRAGRIGHGRPRLFITRPATSATRVAVPGASVKAYSSHGPCLVRWPVPGASGTGRPRPVPPTVREECNSSRARCVRWRVPGALACDGCVGMCLALLAWAAEAWSSHRPRRVQLESRSLSACAGRVGHVAGSCRVRRPVPGALGILRARAGCVGLCRARWACAGSCRVRRPVPGALGMLRALAGCVGLCRGRWACCGLVPGALACAGRVGHVAGSCRVRWPVPGALGMLRALAGSGGVGDVAGPCRAHGARAANWRETTCGGPRSRRGRPEWVGNGVDGVSRPGTIRVRKARARRTKR